MRTILVTGVAGFIGSWTSEALIDRGVLISESTRAPLRLVFPAGLASRWTPGVFPERTV